jgi:fatty-acyl-CoA synthase
VLDPDTGAPIAAVVAWPGQAIGADACRAAVRSAYGDRIAGDLHVLPLNRIPLTEQGKPNRQEIRRLAAGTLTVR